MNQVHYKISNMANQSMKTSLKNALDKMEGIQEVNIDLTQSTVEVEFNEPAVEAQIRGCIEHAGHRIS